MAMTSIPPTNPDPLGAAVDRVVGVIRELLPSDKQALAGQLGLALGDLFAELIGRATAMSASVIGPVLQKVDGVERRERARGERLDQVQREMNGQIDAIHRHMPPDLTEAVHRLAVDVEQLKERQANDDAERPR